MSLLDAASEGRLEGLIALRDHLARELDACESARDTASLSLRFMDVLAQIDELQAGPTPAAAPKSPLDELMARRREKAGKAG